MIKIVLNSSGTVDEKLRRQIVGNVRNISTYETTLSESFSHIKHQLSNIILWTVASKFPFPHKMSDSLSITR